MKLSDLTVDPTPSPTDWYIGVRDNGDGTFTDIRIPIGGYKKRVFKLTQSGSGIPAETIMEDSIGGSITWSRTSAGVYQGVAAGAFPSAKYWAISGSIAAITRIDDNTIQVNTASDGILNNTEFEIRQYP